MQRVLDSAGHSRVGSQDMLSVVEELETRKSDLIEWLGDNAPECEAEQKHLDEGTDCRNYWHYGYMIAIKDVLALLGGTSTSRH